jgi:hypothetical protein
VDKEPKSMTRHSKSNGAAAERRPVVRPSRPLETSFAAKAPVRHITLAAASGRVTKKSTLLRPAARTVAKVALGAATRDELERQLAEAEARILELETRLSAVTDRVAWIADRLHAVLTEQD